MNILTKAIIVTTIVFILGLSTGLLISREQSTNFEDNMLLLKSSVEEAELQFLFLDVMKGNVSCTYMIKEAERLSKQTEGMADEVDKYERTEQISDQTFSALKTKYTAILIKDWLMMEKIKQTCNGTYSTVLYFYSNKNCAGCQEQGISLSYVKIKMSENLMVFAIDSDVDLNIVSGLKEVYNVTVLPTLVINGEIYQGFKSVEQFKPIFCETPDQYEFC